MRQIATQDLESQNIYESAKGVIFTGLPENPADHLIRVRMTLTNLDSSGATVIAGEELMQAGLPVSIEDQPGAAVFTYRNHRTTRH